MIILWNFTSGKETLNPMFDKEQQELKSAFEKRLMSDLYYKN